MKTIWKFTVPVTDSQQIKVVGAVVDKVLSAASHDGGRFAGSIDYIDIWMMVDTHPDSIQFVPIEIRGTGHPLENIDSETGEIHEVSPNSQHIATVREAGLVWHVFLGTITV